MAEYWHGMEPYVVMTVREWPWEKTMKKIVVPTAMLEAVIASVARLEPWSGVTVEHYRTVLEAALRYWSENPIVPTKEQVADIAKVVYADMALPSLEDEDFYQKRSQEFLAEWQRRMFLATAPEVPEEIKDLLETDEEEKCHSVSDHNEMILEAYNRGLKRYSLDRKAKSV